MLKNNQHFFVYYMNTKSFMINIYSILFVNDVVGDYMNNRSNMIKMGQHIAELRKKKKYTQKNLGDILDVSDKTVSKWEKGVVAPDITILNALAKELDVSVEEILSGEEVKQINAIETIDIYSKMTKNKMIKVFIIFLLFLMLCIFFVFRIESYYSWHVTSIYSNDVIATKGYILYNNKESKIVINDFDFDKRVKTYDIEQVSMELYYKDDLIYKSNIVIDNDKDMVNTMKKYSIIIDTNKKIKKNDLSLQYLTIDKNGSKELYKINY